MKYKKSFFPWLAMIIIWNFSFPYATAFQDVLVSVFLYFIFSLFEQK